MLRIDFMVQGCEYRDRIQPVSICFYPDTRVFYVQTEDQGVTELLMKRINDSLSGQGFKTVEVYKFNDRILSSTKLYINSEYNPYQDKDMFDFYYVVVYLEHYHNLERNINNILSFIPKYRQIAELLRRTQFY